MSRLEKELDKLSVKEQGSNTKDIKEATLLLSAPKEDLSVLTMLNLDYQIDKSIKKIEISQKLSILADQFNKKTYTGKELRKLCLKYDLKLLTSNNYKGKIDKDLAGRIRNFDKENNDVTISSQHFFILAPRESFNNSNENENKCLFFYRESPDRNTKDRYLAGDNDVFILVHSWGKEYSKNRKSRFLFYDSNSDAPSTCLGTIICIIMFLISLLFTSFEICFIISLFSLLLFIFNGLTTKIYDNRWNT